MYVIRYDRNKCIGAAICASVAPKFWVMDQDGKADLIKAKDVSGILKLEISEIDFEQNKLAQDSCPALAIEIIKKENNEK